MDGAESILLKIDRKTSISMNMNNLMQTNSHSPVSHHFHFSTSKNKNGNSSCNIEFYDWVLRKNSTRRVVNISVVSAIPKIEKSA